MDARAIDALFAPLFASGRIVDAILVLMAGEAALVALRRRRAGRPALAPLANLAAGAGLMLALRAALVGAPWPWVAAALTAALAGHLVANRAAAAARAGAAPRSRAAPPRAVPRAEALRRREPMATTRESPALPARTESDTVVPLRPKN